MLCALTALLAVTSSIITPDQSQGMSPLNQQIPSQPTPQVRPEPSADSLIGELVGAKYRIRIYAAYPEPLYTIIGINGKTEAVALTAAEVALQFPSLPLLTGSFQSGPRSASDDAASPADSEELPLLSDMPLDDQH